jgi:hypothetical protein
MATYQNPAYLQHINHTAFDPTHHAGALAPYSGIYRCDVCAHEAVSTFGHHLPAQGGVHTHANNASPIAWRLIVASAHT